MKKKYKVLLLIMCTLCLVGCDKKQNLENKKTDSFKHSDLIINTEQKEINTFLNTIFDELDFDNKMKSSTSGTYNEYYIYTYVDKNIDTVFTFYFNKNETFVLLLIDYNRNKNNSIYLVKKLMHYSKFNFSANDLIEIEKIINSSAENSSIELGNYIISKSSSDSLKIKIKVGNNDSSENNINTNNSASNNNKQSTNSNSNTTKSNSNSTQNQQSQVNQSNNNAQSNTSSSISVSKQNAIKKAQSYLNYMAFSKNGLIKQLEFEKFSHEDSVYAVDNVSVDWNQQALKKAKSYLNSMAFSRNGLIKQLEFEEFTSDQAIFGVNNVGADWNQQAVKKAQSYLSHMSFSRDGLISQLEYEGFTHDQAVYGVTQNGL